MIRARQPFDRVVSMRTVDPFVTVHPDTQLKLQAASDSQFADEFQSFKIAIAFSF